MGLPIAGKNGGVSVTNGGVTSFINADKWKVTPKSNDIPTTNFQDIDALGNTFSSGITGVLEADIEFSGWYDTNGAVGPGGPTSGPIFAAPLRLQPGVYGVPGAFAIPITANTLCIYINKSAVLAGASLFAFPSIRIIQVPMDCDVNGRVNLSFSAKSNGPYTFPTR